MGGAIRGAGMADIHDDISPTIGHNRQCMGVLDKHYNRSKEMERRFHGGDSNRIHNRCFITVHSE